MWVERAIATPALDPDITGAQSVAQGREGSDFIEPAIRPTVGGDGLADLRHEMADRHLVRQGAASVLMQSSQEIKRCQQGIVPPRRVEHECLQEHLG